jgi:hypothetical protein
MPSTTAPAVTLTPAKALTTAQPKQPAKVTRINNQPAKVVRFSPGSPNKAPPPLTFGTPTTMASATIPTTPRKPAHHPSQKWFRPGPTASSMAHTETDQDRGREFDGHEIAAAARIRRRQESRNEERLNLANETDLGTTGESETGDGDCRKNSNETTTYLDDDAKAFFRAPVRGPNDSFTPPSWFIVALRGLTKQQTRTPTKSPVQFEPTVEAAERNERLLESVDFELEKLFEKYSDTTLGYGSEFRTVEELKPLIGTHPNFLALSQLLTGGMSYIFTRELDQITKLVELETLLARGNHKSAKDFPKEVGDLLAKDVLHGFTIPLPISAVRQIPNAAVQPLGLVSQWTLDGEGKRVVKRRMTQDLSFSSQKTEVPASINSRINMTAYAEMLYGWCLPRIIHYILALRLKFPWLRILICKYDYSDAYRRIAHSASAAAQTIAIHDGLAFLSLRLTFGGSPNPPTWCLFSEMVTDLANEISQCTEWDPDELFSPAQPTTPEPRRVHDDVPLALCRPMAVAIPISDTGMIGRVDGFIDDLINVFLDTPSNCARQPHVVPLAMHVTSRPHAGDSAEPIPRRPILSIPKLMAEGSPDEVQIVLGWRIDTRRLMISLPDDKYDAWLGELTRIATAGKCKFKDLDRIIGRLNHSSYLVPITRNFLGRLRALLTPRRHDRHVVTLDPDTVADVVLWKGILTQANQGISMNLISTREPDRICWSDACPLGIGGYSLSGRAWRIQIPTSSIVRGHEGVNNLLEFLGMVVNVWLECLDTTSTQSCILAIGDNTSAIGWLFRTSKLDPTEPAHDAHLFVARHLAVLLLEHHCCIASQHINGKTNVVADLLSFTGSGERGKNHPLAFDNPPDDELTQRFRLHLPSQVPANFKISPLPSEILCWITRVLQIAASSLEVAKKGDTRTPTEFGGDGPDSARAPATALISSSLCYPTTSESLLQNPSFSVTGTPLGPPPGTLQGLVSSLWSQTLSAKPQATWLRRFGAISGQAPCTSRAAITSDHS